MVYFRGFCFRESCRCRYILSKLPEPNNACIKTIGASWFGQLGIAGRVANLFLTGTSIISLMNLFLKNPYLAYYYSPEDYFFNTKTPYSNVSYTSGGYSYKEEDHLSDYFQSTQNKN